MTIRVALLGYGLGGRSFHAPIIAVTPGLELSAIVTSDAERQRAARSEHPGVRVLSTAPEVLNSADVDLVVISTPNRTHVALALHNEIEFGTPGALRLMCNILAPSD